MSDKNYIEIARKLGAFAFANSLKSVPIHKKKFMELLKEFCKINSSATGASIPLFDAWINAWNRANSTAPY